MGVRFEALNTNKRTVPIDIESQHSDRESTYQILDRLCRSERGPARWIEHPIDGRMSVALLKHAADRRALLRVSDGDVMLVFHFHLLRFASRPSDS